MNLAANKKTLAASGAVLGLIAALLAYTGNPKNMAICVACFIRDISGAVKLHTTGTVQYMRPEIVGFVCGAFLIALITKEYRSTAGSSPMIRFLLGVIMMIGSLVFLGCPLRMVIRMSAGDLNAYVALIGFVGGVYTGTLALKHGFSLGRAYPAEKASGYILPAVLVILLVLSVTTTLFAFSESGPGSMHAPVLLALGGGLHRVLADALDARIRGKLIVKLCHVVSDDDLVLPGLRKGSLHARNIFDGFFVGLLRICQHEPHPRNAVGYRLDIFLAADQLQKLLHIISVLTHKTVPSSPFYFSGARFAPLV